MLYALINLVHSTFEQIHRGGTECECMQIGLDNGHHTKGSLADSTLQPYGLSCQFPGLYYYACGGSNHHHIYFASGGITSHPAPFPHSPGEDDSWIPSCNRCESNYYKTVLVQVKQFEIWLQMQCKFQKLGIAVFFLKVCCGVVMVSVVFFVKL